MRKGQVSQTSPQKCLSTPSAYAAYATEYHARVLQGTKTIFAYELYGSSNPFALAKVQEIFNICK